MKNFEKKIIKACKENDIQKIFLKVWIALVVAMVLGICFKAPKIIFLLILILMFVSAIFEKAVQKISLTKDEVLCKNNLFLVVFSDKNVWLEIFWIFLLIVVDTILVGIDFTTVSIFIDILLVVVIAVVVFFLSDQIAKFFENKLK